jgi:putative ABC transport system substrate-binding protein
MLRREFIALAGGAVVWPFVAHGRDAGTIGFLSSVSPPQTEHVEAFRLGLKDEGFIEGENVAIEYRWAEGHYDRLPDLAAELVRQRVTLIAAAGGTVAARAAIAATKTIPILFVSGYDPTQVGLADQFSRPGANVTGVSVYTAALAAKRLEALRELLPTATTIAVLINPNTLTVDVDTKINNEIGDLQAAARESKLRVLIFKAGSESDFEPVFEAARRQNAQALLVTADPYFTSMREQLVALASRYALPAAYPWREYPAAGGLMSYGPRITWAYGQIGDYAGQILKGAEPHDLPIRLPTMFEFVINLKTARALGLKVPKLTLQRADEVMD